MLINNDIDKNTMKMLKNYIRMYSSLFELANNEIELLYQLIIRATIYDDDLLIPIYDNNRDDILKIMNWTNSMYLKKIKSISAKSGLIVKEYGGVFKVNSDFISVNDYAMLLNNRVKKFNVKVDMKTLKAKMEIVEYQSELKGQLKITQSEDLVKYEED